MTKTSTRDSSTLKQEQSSLIQKTVNQELSFFQEHLQSTSEYINLFSNKKIRNPQKSLETLYILCGLEENIRELTNNWGNKLLDSNSLKQEGYFNQELLSLPNFKGSLLRSLFHKIFFIKRHLKINLKQVQAANSLMGDNHG